MYFGSIKSRVVITWEFNLQERNAEVWGSAEIGSI